MKLLLLAVAVCAVWPCSVLAKPSKQARDLHAYPYVITSPDGSKDPIPINLYSYSVNNNPFETNLRHYGQNPDIPDRVNRIQPYTAQPFPVNLRLNDPISFHKGSVQAFPSAPQQVFTYDALEYVEEYDDGFVPLRSAVESIPVEAEVYSHLRNPDEYSDSLQFNREGVEALPFFPSPYTGGFNDEDRNAFVVEVDNEYDQIGYRGNVEAHPHLGFSGQTNGRPFGQLSEPYSGGHIPVVDNEVDSVTPYRSSASARSSDKKLVCYFGGWSIYRPKPFDFAITDIDPFSCTHIIYSFAGLDETNWSIKSLDPELDIVQGAYKAAIGLKDKNPNLKVMIAIGGWNEGGKRYSEMASKKERRDAFVASVISFMEEHQWDGLDLDWEYPGASDRGGRFSDKANFAALVSELSAEFKTRGWLLTAAVSPARFRVNEGYDVAKIAQDLDYIFVMTYDLRGSWDGKADHHSPLMARDTDAWAFKSLNTKDGLNYWHTKGAPMHKLLMGIPFYGRTFTLTSTSNTKPGAQAKSGGNEGKYSQERGFLAYYEICQEQRNGGWEMARDSVGGPYMVKGDQWVGYDDTEYIETKMGAVHSMGLGGAFTWAIDLDDNLGVCGTKWPLINTMRKGLYGTDPTEPPITSQTPATVQTPIDTTPEESTTSGGSPSGTPTPSTSQSTDTTPNPYICSSPGYFREESDCSVYYLCNSELIVYKFTCPEGLYFDLKNRICNWPRNVKCGTGFSPLLKSYNFECLEELDGLYSDPYDCRRYKWCKNGVATSFSCKEGQHFNPQTGVCSSPDQTLCIPGESFAVSDSNAVAVSDSNAVAAVRKSGEYKVVCYFTNWAWYRRDGAKFVPENIDPRLCTHIIYSYAILDTVQLEIFSHDPFTDFDNDFYQRVLDLKKKQPTLKVMLAIGGWTDSAGDKYSRLVSDPKARLNFVRHTTEILQAYSFDGLDLHWEYPVCWQFDCTKGPADDRQGFTALVKELRVSFNKASPPLILSTAVAAGRGIINRAYDVPIISRNVDFINLLSYNFHGHWERKTGHVSPLKFRNGDTYESQNTDFAVNYLVSKGAQKNKIVMGIPFFGQSFTLTNANQNGLNAPVRGPGHAGPLTQERGMLAYYEICNHVRADRWTKKTDATGAIGPFAYKGDQWVSYEDPASVKRKAEYIKEEGLGGAMIWSMDFDDFNNKCCREPMPLLRAVNRVLRDVGIPPPRPGGFCVPVSPVVTPTPPITTTTYNPGVGGTKKTTAYGEHTTATVKPTTPPWWVPSSTMMTSWKPVTTGTTPSTSTTTPSTTTTATTTTSRRPTTQKTWWPTQATSPVTQPTPSRITTESTSTSTSKVTWWKPPATTTIRTSPSTSKVTWWKPPPTTTIRTTVERAPSTPIPGHTPGGMGHGDKCQGNGYHPVKGQCAAFLRCNQGYLVQSQCATGLHWNQKKGLCDWPNNANCPGATSRVTVNPTGTPPSTPPSTPVTAPNTPVTVINVDATSPPPCQEGSYMRNPTDCSGYFLCVHGAWGSYGCPDGLLWNDSDKRCDWPKNVKCNALTPPITPPTITSSTTNVDSDTPTSTAATIKPIPVLPSQKPSGDYMVVCYFTNWAWYRPGIGKYTPDDIDPSVCTHVVYGFAVLDYSNLIIKPHDTWADFDNKFYEKVTALKAQGIKVTIAIGGWNDSAGDKYSRLVNNPAARAKFITHVIEFIKKHNFDGLDLDWEYPVCWQVDCNKGPTSDKEGFSMLVKELSAAFKPEGLLLSAAVSPSKKVIDAGYDVPVLSAYMDWIAVMTYDFHGHWDKKTGHVAPMYDHPEADYDYFNMDFSIRYWHEKGAAKNKLVLGMPLYGQSFSINDPANTGLNSPARSGGNAGQFTRAKGFLAYYEICEHVRQGWTVVQDPEGRMGPYAYSGNQWVSYDDVAMIRKKSQYIRDQGLAGGMVWALDLDDFNNRCGQGKSPLMNTIMSVLGPAKTPIDVPPIDVSPIDVVPEVTSRPGAGGATSGTVTDKINDKDVGQQLPPSDEYKVVCYFTNWAWYRQGEGKYTPDDIDASLCTHIVYGFAVLDNKNLLIKPHDTWADYDNKFYKKVTDLKNAPNKPKVLVAIGGWNDSAGDKYSKLVNSPAARAKFNKHVIEFIQNNNFDGLDLDWEYPVCWQVNCEKGPASDKQAFADWVKELHVAFKPHGLLLSAAVSPSNKVIDAGYDVPTVSKYLDWVAVMTYDYHGQWDKKTGHVAPMYAHSADDNLAFNTNFTIHYWIEGGADPKKLVMGMPMYGQSFSLASASNNGLNQKSYGGGQAGPYTRARGFLAYYEICHSIQNQEWTVVRDSEESMGPYAYRGNQWVGFDDIPMIRYKSEYIKKMGLGGGMIWALDLDDFRNRCGCEPHPLLRTINRVLRGTHGPDPECPLLSSKPMTTRGPDLPLPSPKFCEIGEYKKHHTDCSKFFQCNQNKYEERACFPGLHWNPAPANRCDWPGNAKCQPDQSPAPSVTTVPQIKTTTTERPAIPQTAAPTKKPNQGGWTGYVPWTPSTTSTTVGPLITIPDTGYKVVCYFTNWAWYRQGAGKYRPDDIDAELCTHVVYGFAVLDSSRLLIKPHDTWADYDNYFYKKVTNLRQRGVKVTLAIGGWNDSLGPKYSKLVSSAAARARFNAHVVEFLLKHNFDGLDLDWEYPKCWQVDCKKGPDSDKPNFTAWVRELHAAFQPHGLLLSAAVSPSNKVIDAGYEVAELNKYFDWIAVMTYDYHGHWDKKTGHVAPMYHHVEGPNPKFNANFTMNYWRELGADPKKLIMGMPTYGQAFSLKDTSNTGLNSLASKGQAGKYTRAAGFLAYYEICHKIRNEGYTVVEDASGTMGPYAYKGNQWVGYDDIAMIRHKSEYIKRNGFGGGMIWALDLDDFRGNCGCGTHPLLRTINQVLRNVPGPPTGCGL